MRDEKQLPASDDARPGNSVKGSRESILFVVLVVVVVGMALAAYARYLSPDRPGVTTRLGFNGFFDQSEYLKSAKILSHFHLPSRPDQYRFGLGYPALAVPFLWIGFHGDPFAPVDVLTYGATAALTFVLGTRLPLLSSQRGRIAGGLAAAAIATVASPLLELNTSPINTSITVPLTLLVLVIATSAHQVSYPRAIAIGAALGWIFAARYADGVFVGLPVIALVVLRTPRERRRIVVGGGATVSVIVALVLFTQFHAFGNPLITPYHYHLRASGANDQSLAQFHLAKVPTNFLGTFVTGLQNGRRLPRDPILRQFPLLWLAPIGAAVVVGQRVRDRLLWMTMTITSLMVSIFYLAFVAGGPYDLLFSSPRYWAAWYPLWSVFIVATAVAGIEQLTSRSMPTRSDFSRGNDP
jgi:hypothetical protein